MTERDELESERDRLTAEANRLDAEWDCITAADARNNTLRRRRAVKFNRNNAERERVRAALNEYDRTHNTEEERLDAAWHRITAEQNRNDAEVIRLNADIARLHAERERIRVARACLYAEYNRNTHDRTHPPAADPQPARMSGEPT